jgi:uncharacterized membrane protein
MNIPDCINAVFEALAGFMVLMHCWQLYKDKAVKGVSVWATVFFNVWGFWNLFYYPHLDQWLSFFGGLSITSANTLWICMMIYYIRKSKVNKNNNEV